MRIRLSQLRRIIKEEASRALTESDGVPVDELKKELYEKIEENFKSDRYGEGSVRLRADNTNYRCDFKESEGEGTFSIYLDTQNSLESSSDDEPKPIAVFSIVHKEVTA